ncbi:MAG: hypothetical protein FJW39_13605 [Acidobacteria bacterium]|nr:hypothetical protein [Acidobacteriota bacterium]
MLRIVGVLGAGLVLAQPTLRRQDSDQSVPVPMTPAEIASLGDPFVRLVLRPNPAVTSLDQIDQLILGPSTANRRLLFIVSEQIADPAIRPGSTRRTVTAFSGLNSGIRLNPNVMLSVDLHPSGFSPVIESWGWDDAARRYNFYRLDGEPLTWKFRGSSLDADIARDRSGKCIRCHISGAPVMKELLLPWNNWHSPRSIADYLTPGAPNAWPVANTPRLGNLASAEDLMNFVISAIRRFTTRRIEALANGTAVSNGPRLLAPLFSTTEYNIASAEQLTNLHPIPNPVPNQAAPPVAIDVPDVFFLNANQFAGAGITGYQGLGLPEARKFDTLVKITPAEYRSLVRDIRTGFPDRRGDANFAWFVPEASHADNEMIDQILRRGIISREFAASVLAVDIENPVFSPRRARLLGLVPQSFNGPAALTKAVLDRLNALNPQPNTPEADFRTLLSSADPAGAVRARITAYHARVQAQLNGGPAARRNELRRLYRLMLDRRLLAGNDAILRPLVESPLLFPRRVQ